MVEAAPGRVSALPSCKHRREGIKVFVLIWQGQPGTVTGSDLLGKREMTIFSIYVIIGLSLWADSPRAVRNTLICFFSSRRANGV